MFTLVDDEAILWNLFSSQNVCVGAQQEQHLRVGLESGLDVRRVANVQ